MTAWLIKRFIKNPEDTQNQAVREQYGTLGSLTGMALNLLLSALKILLGFLTGSVAVTADGVNNLSDAGGSLIALVSVRLAQRSADDSHPFGHGRVEYLGALSVGVLIAFFGIELLKSGIESILNPAATSFSVLTVVLLAVGMLIKLWMYFFYTKLGKKSDNPTLLAAGKDSLSDVLATGAVVLSVAAALVLGWQIDGIMGCIVSLLVLKAAWEVLSDTVSRLLGGKPDKEQGQKLIDMLLSYPGILGLHDLVIHDYGPGRVMASVHAEVAANSNLVEIHEVIDRAEWDISHELNIPVCIHLDPIASTDSETNAACSAIQQYLAQYTPPLKLHDFRMVPGENRVNLVFDVLLPPSLKNEGQVARDIKAYACGLDKRYFCVIRFDRDYYS